MSITNKIAVKLKIFDLKTYGRSEITTRKQLQEFPVGSLISYLNIDGVFKRCGFLYAVKNDWFIYLTLDCEQKVRVRFCNVDKMYVGDVFKVIGDTISFNPGTKTTRFPVVIDNHTVYYAPSSQHVKRFMVTKKYENMVNWYNYFHSKSETE